MSETVAIALSAKDAASIKKPRMSLRKLITIRENSKKSTGPKDCSLSRFGALKHGLRARQPIIPGEEMSELEQLRESVYDRLKPQGKIEEQYANQVVSGLWRLQRGMRAEDAIMEIYGDLENTHWSIIFDKNYLRKIASFENHASNQVDGALDRLAQLRKPEKLEG